MKKSYAVIIFLLLLGCVSFYYGYHKIAFKRPQSIHKWRQVDCASIALNYYQGGMHFFQPELNLLSSKNWTSGKSCPSEIPLICYFVAILYKIFGYHEWIFRILNTLIFLTGLFCLFRIFQYFLKDVFWPIAITLLLFTSPVLVYYGNNFLTNSSSLAFSIIGWYYFLRFINESRNKWFYISMFCLLIAATFKITGLISLFAIAGIWLMEVLKIKRFKNDVKLFTHPWKYLIPFLAIFGVIIAWVLFARAYNQRNGSHYFNTFIFPIWDMDKAEIKEILKSILNRWIFQYFHLSVLIFIGLCSLFILTRFRKNNPVLIYSILFILIEVIIYFLMQFFAFSDHDYFTIDMYILPAIIFICAFDVLKRQKEKIFNSWILKGLFSILLAFNIYFAHSKTDERYSSWMNDYPRFKDIYTITPYLRQIGLTPGDTVISIPDYCAATLYLMNQKGWTEYTDPWLNSNDPKNYSLDSSGIQQSINRGAKYLIVNGIDEIYKNHGPQAYCKNLVGHYNNVLIFDLKKKDVNPVGNNLSNGVKFKLNERVLMEKASCDAEKITSDRANFIGNPEGTLFQFGVEQSQEYSHSGKYSAKLDVSMQYGMTIRFKNVRYSESFTATVWRKAIGKSKGTIIASGESYYNTDYKIAETGSEGWEKISLDFFIPYDLNDKDLSIFLFNAEKEPVYFDDLEITRYKSMIK